MKKETVELGSLILVGLTARTNNRNEMDPKKAKIGSIAGSYWGNGTANEFKNRKNPGVTYSVYTEFESDEHGEYTYFIGEEVSSVDQQDLSKFKVITIPEGTYQKFTAGPGKMPDIIINAWQNIWSMKKEDFAGKRTYLADFEIYDHRAMDPTNAIADIYIGVMN